MNLKLTEEQQMIASAAAEFLAAAADIAAVRATAASADGHDRALWQGMAEQGWCGVHVAESAGGLGLGWVELCLLQEQLGRRLAGGVFFDSVVLAATALQALGAHDWLADVAGGALIATLAFEGDALAAPQGEGWRLSGRWPQVGSAGNADLLLLTARDAAGEPIVFALPAGTAGLSITPLVTIDATRRSADVVAQDVVLPAAACLVQGAVAAEALARTRDLAAIGLAAAQLGSAQQCLDITLAYAAQRVQFGQAIARFQAVKHRCAEMLVKIEAARSAVLGAATVADAAPDARQLDFAAALARSEATAAAMFCAQEAIQLHGGVGYTWDYEPQLYFKRAQADSQRLGVVPQWLERVAAQCLDAPAAPAAAGADEAGAEAEFRAAVRAWMRANLQGEFEALRGRHGPGEDGFDAGLAKRWEQALAAGGWVGLGWPEAAGGRGLPLSLQVIFHEEYVRGGGPGRLGHIGEQLLAPTLIAHGTPELQARFLPGIRAGAEYWAQGYSEPGAGSDLANVRTRARLDEASGEWVIAGQKVWTSWAQESDWIFVLARTEEGSQRHQGLSLLLVPLRQPGVEVRPIRQMTGGAEFNEVFFEGARTAADCVLGARGNGWKVAMALLGYERGASTLGQQAQFRRELDLVVAVAQANGAARDPLLRQRIAAAELGLANLRHHALRVLGEDAGGASRADFTSKYAWSNWRRSLGQLAIDVLGVAGDVAGGDAVRERLQQVWLSSRADTIYAGTNEIQLNLIAERALEMPR